MNGLSILQSRSRLVTKPYRRGAENLIIPLGPDSGGWTSIPTYDFREYRARYQAEPPEPKYILIFRQIETSEKLESLPPGIIFPAPISDKIRYDTGTKTLIFKGAMSIREMAVLLDLSPDKLFKIAVETLFEKSQFQKTGNDALDIEVEFSNSDLIVFQIPPHTLAGTSFGIPSPAIFDTSLRLFRFRQAPIPLPGVGAENWGIIALLGNIAKLAWVMGWEKVNVRQHLQDVQGQRCRVFAHGFSLDMLGSDLRVPRFPPREHSFDSNTIALYHLNDDFTTKLANTVDAMTISINVVSTLGFPSSPPFKIRIDNEIMVVTAMTTTTWTMTRGTESTTAASHVRGASVIYIEANGQVIDDTKRFGLPDHPGINRGAQKGAIGKFGTAFRFPGSGSSGAIEIPHHSDFDILADRSFTAEAFVNCEDRDGSAPRIVVMKGQLDSEGALVGAGWSLSLGDFRGITNNVRWAVSDGASPPLEIFADLNIADGKFHHLAGVIDRERRRFRLFVDGEERTNDDISALGAIANSQNILIGRGSGDNQFYGVIDEMRFSKIARSDFHPVLGESDEAYRQRLGIFERWLLPTPDALLKTINSQVQINGEPDSFMLIEKDHPGASASKIVRILPESLSPGQSIDFEGNMRSREENISGRPEDDVEFNEIYLLRHDHPQVNYGSEENKRRMQAKTKQTLDHLLDLLAAAIPPITGRLIIDKSHDSAADSGLHRVGRALLLQHETLSLEQLSVYAHRAGFDFVQNNGRQIYASVASGEMLEIIIEPTTTSISNAIDGVTTSIEVAPTSDFPSMPPFRIRIENEIMIVTEMAGTTWTVTRNVDATGAAPHGRGVTVLHIPAFGIDVFNQKAINLHFAPESLPSSGQIRWICIRCGAGRAHFEAHPEDLTELRTPVQAGRRLRLIAEAPGEITVRVEYTFQRRTVAGTRTIRISIEQLQSEETIAADGNMNVLEAQASGAPEQDFDPIYLITHDAGLDYGTNPDNKRMQIVLEKPLNRLVELLTRLGKPPRELDVLLAYQPGSSDLHEVGRALLIRHSTLAAEVLGALAHQAGFSFVDALGERVYCSVAAGEKIEIVRCSDPECCELAPLENELTVNAPVKMRVRFTELPAELRFDIEPVHQTDLDARIISDGLRIEFENQGFSLSNRSTVCVENPGLRWQINDHGRIFFVKDEASSLNVYTLTGIYNWSLDEIGHGRGAFNSVLRPQVTFTPREPGFLFLNVTYLKPDDQSTFPYTFEIMLKGSLNVPETIIPKHQYDLIMNILNYFHPIGVEVITENIREHVVEVRENLLNAFPGYTYPDFRF